MRHLDGGHQPPTCKSQHQHNNPPATQQNHTHRTHLISIHHPTGLGTPPVRFRNACSVGVRVFVRSIPRNVRTLHNDSYGRGTRVKLHGHQGTT